MQGVAKKVVGAGLALVLALSGLFLFTGAAHAYTRVAKADSDAVAKALFNAGYSDFYVYDDWQTHWATRGGKEPYFTTSSGVKTGSTYYENYIPKDGVPEHQPVAVYDGSRTPSGGTITLTGSMSSPVWQAVYPGAVYDKDGIHYDVQVTCTKVTMSGFTAARKTDNFSKNQLWDDDSAGVVLFNLTTGQFLAHGYRADHEVVWVDSAPGAKQDISVRLLKAGTSQLAPTSLNMTYHFVDIDQPDKRGYKWSDSKNSSYYEKEYAEAVQVRSGVHDELYVVKGSKCVVDTATGNVRGSEPDDDTDLASLWFSSPGGAADFTWTASNASTTLGLLYGNPMYQIDDDQDIVKTPETQSLSLDGDTATFTFSSNLYFTCDENQPRAITFTDTIPSCFDPATWRMVSASKTAPVYNAASGTNVMTTWDETGLFGSGYATGSTDLWSWSRNKRNIEISPTYTDMDIAPGTYTFTFKVDLKDDLKWENDPEIELVDTSTLRTTNTVKLTVDRRNEKKFTDTSTVEVLILLQSLKVEKQSYILDWAENLYDISNATYGLYTLPDCSDDSVLTFKSDTAINPGLTGTYYVKEISVPTSGDFELDETIWKVKLKVTGGNIVLTSVEDYEACYPRVLLMKCDVDNAGVFGQGNAGRVDNDRRDFKGVRFNVDWYATYDTSRAVGEPSAPRTVWEVDANGKVQFATGEPVEGTWMFKQFGYNCMPYGTYVITENTAPVGYNPSEERYIIQVTPDRGINGNYRWGAKLHYVGTNWWTAVDGVATHDPDTEELSLDEDLDEAFKLFTAEHGLTGQSEATWPDYVKEMWSYVSAHVLRQHWLSA